MNALPSLTLDRSTLFSNREIATAIWLIPLCSWLLSKPPVRASCKQLLQSFLHRTLATSVALMFLYAVAIVAVLRVFNGWHIGFLKDTIIWFCFTAFAMVFKFVTVPVEGNIFKSIAKDNVKAILILEFIVNAYNFPLLGELAFVPVITIITILNAFAEAKDEYKSVAKLTMGVLSVTGFVLFYLAISDAISRYQELGNSETLLAIALPPLLSLLFAPFVFAAVVYATYERVFLRLSLGKDKPCEVVQYARRRLIRHFGLRIGKLSQFLSDNPANLMHVQSNADVDSLLAASLHRARSQLHQPKRGRRLF